MSDDLFVLINVVVVGGGASYWWLRGASALLEKAASPAQARHSIGVLRKTKEASRTNISDTVDFSIARIERIEWRVFLLSYVHSTVLHK